MFYNCSFQAFLSKKEECEYDHKDNDEQDLKFYESSLLFHFFTPFPRTVAKMSSAEISNLAAGLKEVATRGVVSEM